jgi:hypothetical protein
VDADRRGGYGEAFRVREFRVIFTAQCISMPGSVIAGLAV